MLATALALTLAASSTTKLGVYVVGDDDTSKTILAACPPVAVFSLSLPSAVPASQIAAFRSACPPPGSKVVAQVGFVEMSVDATTASNFWWNTWLPLLQQANLDNIDAVEGPPGPSGDFATLASFWSSFADFVQQIGKLPIVGSLPPGTTATYFCPTATAMLTRGKAWAWSYHGFSASLTQSVATETALFWYRNLRSACGLGGVPIYLTQLANMSSESWQSADLGWLAWVDGQLAQDAEVVTAALFAAGGSTQPLTAIAPDLAAYFQNPSPTPADGGVPDGGTDGGTDGGSHDGVVPPEGGLIPSGPPGQASSGCATAGAGFGLLTVVPLLLARRRARRRDDTDGGRAV